jgi:hypothetical protein
MKRAPQIVEPHCEWTSDQLADESLWSAVLTDAEIEEIDAALRHALAKSDDVLEIGRQDFPLPTLHARLAGITRDLIDGRGFVRLRGIDRGRYSQAEMEMLYWGIGMHLGAPWPQNKHGHVLGDVTDYGKSVDDPTARVYQLGRMALPFHCDGSDLVGLMCLANAVSGGLSAVANAVTIHNRMVREDVALAAELYKPQPYDFHGEEKPGAAPYYWLPVFTHWNRRLFVRCIPAYIFASQRHADAPRLTATAIRALQRLAELANDPATHVRMELRPGDMQFINNYHVLHGRTAYEDDRAAGRVRHLKRLWLETDAFENRPPYFASNAGSHWNERRSASRMRVSG